jgi:tripartite-type tricarboxylate transporter receptor subunit TctC
MRRTLIAVLLLLFNAGAQAQQYPSSPVRVLVGYAAGGAPDIQARTIAQQLAIHFNQSFYIENKTGANGTIAARAVATSAPDGLTLLFSSSSIAPTPHVYKNLGYDTLTDLRAIATSGILDGMLMLVDARSPVKTVPEFIKHAKEARALYGSPGVGNILHLATEAFSIKAGITM